MYEIGSEYYQVGDEWNQVGDEWYEDEGYSSEDLDAMLGAAPRVLRRGRGFRRPASTRRVYRGRGGRATFDAREAAQARAAALAMREASQGALYRTRGPGKARTFPIGFDSVAAVVAGAAANINQQPQIPFKPHRILVPAAIAAFFQLTDVRVGKDSQLVAAGAIPATTFAETAFDVELDMDTCQISQLLILQILNFDGANHRFMASMIGQSLEF